MRNDRKRKEEPNKSTEKGKAFSAVGTRHVFGNVIPLKPTDKLIRKSLREKCILLWRLSQLQRWEKSG